MKLFEKYVLPKIHESVSCGVKNCVITIDHAYNQSLFCDENVEHLCEFIENFRISKNKTSVTKVESETVFGKRFKIKIRW